MRPKTTHSDTKTLRVERLAAAVSLPVENIEVQEYIDQALGQAFYRITTKVLCDNFDGDTVSWPASTWEYFKFQYMPKWFTNKFPVRYKTKRIDFRVMYPHYALPNLGSAYIQVITTD